MFAEKTGLFKSMDYVLHPVSSMLRGEKFRALISKVSNEDFFIFDYQYHDKAGLWIDHHQNHQMGNDPIINEKICYDNRAASATNLVGQYLTFLGMNLSDSDYAMIKSVDMIDTAGYPSIEFIFKDKSPIMLMRAYFEFSYPLDMMICRTSEILAACGMNIEKANKILNIDDSYVDLLERKAINTKNRLEVYNKFSVLRQKQPYQYPRYSEYYCVNTKYNIRISEESKDDFRLSISYNKWSKEKNYLNIGSYCISNKLIKDGGGHYNIGGGVIKRSKIDEFLDQFSEKVEG